MAKRTLRIFTTLIIILLIIAGAILFGLNRANTLVEQELASQLDRALSSSDSSAALDYDEIRSDLLRGTVSLLRVSFLDDEMGLHITADELALRILLSELLQWGLRRETNFLSTADITAEALAFSDPGTNSNTSVQALRISLGGAVSPQLLEDGQAFLHEIRAEADTVFLVNELSGSSAACRKIAFSGRGVTFQKDIAKGNLHFDDASVSAEEVNSEFPKFGGMQAAYVESSAAGIIGEKLLSGNLRDVISSSEKTTFSMKDLLINFEQPMLSALEAFGLSSLSRLLRQDVPVREFSFALDTVPEGFSMQSMDLDSDLLTFQGNFDIKFDEMEVFEDFQAELLVDSLHGSLREPMLPFSFAMGQPIPAGSPFTIRFALNKNGIQEFSIEPQP